MNNREISRSCSKSFDSKDASESRSPHSDTRDRYFNAERSISRERSRKRASMGHYGDYRSKRRESQRIRSRSRSSHRFKNKYSRSRSKSYTSRKRRSIDRHRSNSRSPNFGRRRHIIPQMSRCLGVFGLSVYTTQSQIMDIFSKFGPIDRVQVIIDAKSGRSRGYCFVYYEKTEDAKVAKEECCGMEIDARRIRVDYSITQRPHTPTPGVYMGRPLRRHQDYYNRYRDDDDHYDRSSRYSKRSPSPYKGRFRRYERSRSRSYSPRDRKYR